MQFRIDFNEKVIRKVVEFGKQVIGEIVVQYSQRSVDSKLFLLLMKKAGFGFYEEIIWDGNMMMMMMMWLKMCFWRVFGM